MKQVRILLFVLFFSTAWLNDIQACEIEFEVVDGNKKEDGDKKEVYKEGDVLVIKVKATLTHRFCTIGINKTRFYSDGLKVLGATDWKETSTNIWERKLKVKVTDNDSGKLMISAKRTCDKQGGFGSLTLQGETG